MRAGRQVKSRGAQDQEEKQQVAANGRSAPSVVSQRSTRTDVVYCSSSQNLF